MFIPSVLYITLKRIHERFENAEFIISDFSNLPCSLRNEGDVLSLNKPIVSIKKENSDEKEDYEDILDPVLGTSDIFFQTDFYFFNFMYQKIFNKEVVVNYIGNCLRFKDVF